MNKAIYRGPRTPVTTILVGVHLEGWEGKRHFQIQHLSFQAVLYLSSPS